jgi:formamidopyrimidine-DNA glycosylase
MPELPEVETMCRSIAAIVGAEVRDVFRPRPRLRLRPIAIWPRFGQLRRRVIGQTISAVSRVGKRVVVELVRRDAAPRDRLVFEPRMSGLVLLADPPDQEHLRLCFELCGGCAEQLLFWSLRGLGAVRLLSPVEFGRLLGPDRVGPDALEVSAEMLRQRLGRSRRAIKVALLDQRALAGIGNLYASEILHRAGIAPQLPCHRLGPRRWVGLHAAMRDVLQQAVRHEGSTLRDGTYRSSRPAARRSTARGARDTPGRPDSGPPWRADREATRAKGRWRQPGGRRPAVARCLRRSGYGECCFHISSCKPGAGPLKCDAHSAVRLGCRRLPAE